MANAPDDKDPFNLDLFIKLMKMTTATEDTMALVAIRKANAHLAKVGGDWDRLLRGKVRIVADPFAGTDSMQLRTPPSYAPARPPAPPPRPASGYTRMQKPPQWPPSATPHPQPQPAPAAKPTTPSYPINSTFTNKFSGYCYCCGLFQGANKGWIFEPQKFNAFASVHNTGQSNKKWAVVCTSCNRDPKVRVANKKAREIMPTTSNVLDI